MTTQPLEALEKANRVRSDHARVLHELRGADPAEARRRISELLLSPPAALHSLRVERLIVSTPYVGKVKAAQVLRRAGVLSTRPVGQLTVRQRMALAEEVGA